MPNAFGFSPPNQNPTPDPRQVGERLMQPRQQPQRAPPEIDDRLGGETVPRSRDEALRREGGKLMGSGGSDADSALSAAVGEALTRAGGGHRGNPNPAKNRDARVLALQQLGISPLEAELLRETI